VCDVIILKAELFSVLHENSGVSTTEQLE